MSLPAETLATMMELATSTAKTCQDNELLSVTGLMRTLPCILSLNSTCFFLASASANKTLAELVPNAGDAGDYTAMIQALIQGSLLEGAAFALSLICIVLAVCKLTVIKTGSLDWSWIKTASCPPNLSVRTVALLVSALAMAIASWSNGLSMTRLDAQLEPNNVMAGFVGGIVQMYAFLVAGVQRFSQVFLTRRRKKLYQWGWNMFSTVWTMVILVLGLIHLQANRDDQESLFSLFYKDWFLALCLYFPVTYVLLGLYAFSLKLWKLDKEIKSNTNMMDATTNQTFSTLVMANTLLTPAVMIGQCINTGITLGLPGTVRAKFVMCDAERTLRTHRTLAFGFVIRENDVENADIHRFLSCHQQHSIAWRDSIRTYITCRHAPQFASGALPGGILAWSDRERETAASQHRGGETDISYSLFEHNVIGAV
ncbi:hypothetical protein HK104_001317 [Borealophlyctis nickersoniae]|nr:hypothetical protein HK104_001317 [Borealophlyctis nickersoniae]